MRMEVAMRTPTSISKRLSSSTSQLSIATIPTTVTGIASVSERGILKEANLERRIKSQVPQKEIARPSNLLGGNFHKRHGNEIQRNEKCLEASKCSHDTLGNSGIELEKNENKDEHKQSRSATGQRISEGKVRSKKSTITSQGCSNSKQQKPKPIVSGHEYGRDVMSD